jgi:hypothetical protein
LVLSAFYIKNFYEKIQHTVHKEIEELYITIKGGKMQEDQDFRIQLKGHRAVVTDMQKNEEIVLRVKDFELEYGAILRMDIDNTKYTT